MINAHELRQSWSVDNKLVLADGTADNCANKKKYYTVENFEREFKFEKCKSITFYEGQEIGDKFLMSATGSGHIAVPAGVLLVVEGGKARCDSAGSIFGGGGIRAPPPSRVSDYAPSSADSGYSGSYAGGNSHPSPPRDRTTFNRAPGSTVSISNCSIAPSDSASNVGRR
ncbi:uncharacterized protein C8A04DRAFT_32987 [Dichotomopilus funicola]|uniref:Uncharacterized protein n=1 Tax=Dichotomopilus funicola TaxID=1934379 RepID=A0AAN6UV50_9PEZI|nr:hypothetical protein C8A04DRAFT_32987 [Dichotomopilus funicola]